MDEQTYRSKIDPDFVQAYDESVGFDLRDLRQNYLNLLKADIANLKEDPAVDTYETFIEGPADHPQLKVRVYRPAGHSDDILPVALWFHGGGYVLGSVYNHNDFCLRYCKGVGCCIISVDYRLAMDAKEPAAVEDAYAALCYVHSHPNQFGIDPNRIAAFGLSAGGGITAALALMTRDRKGPELVLQMPLYAMLDHRMNTVSAKEVTDHHVWSTPYSEIGYGAYLDPEKEVSYYASPMLCENFEGVAPLFSYIGTLDPFRDENMAYWSKLMQAGIPVEAHVYPNVYHCFEVKAPDQPLAQTAYRAGFNAMKKAFKML